MHERLLGQIHEHFGGGEPDSSGWKDFVAAVDRTYREFEEARAALERGLERSFGDLTRADREMRDVLTELTRQREFLRQILDLNPHFIFAKDRAGRFTLVNRAVADAYGTSVENLLGKTDADFNPIPGEVEHFREDDLEVLDTGRDKIIPEEMITDATGAVRWLHTIKRAIPAPAGGEAQVLGVGTDITDRRRAEETLREHTRTLQAHQEALHGLALLDPSDWPSALRAITETAARVLGVPRVGVWMLRDGGGSLVCEGMLVDGTFDSEPGLTVDAPRFPRYFQAVAESRTVAADDALADPRTNELAETYLVPLGITSMLDVPIRLRGSLVGVFCHEHVGPPRTWSPDEQHFAASLADFVSLAIAAADRQRLEEELRHSQKMEALGHLAGGVAHDFNNILTAILGTCQLMLSRMESEDPNRSQVQLVKESADRAALLTRQLLAVSRKQVMDPRVIDMNRVLTEMEPMLRRLVDETIAFEFVPAAQPARVRADPGQMEQVLLNLVINAGDAMPRGGRLRVQISASTLDEFGRRRRPRNDPGPYVCLSVADSGVGMDAAVRGRIFEPFFTTKESGKGTGLGLSIVYGIVEQFGGWIEVSSEPGRGSVFSIRLPAVLEEVENRETPSAPEPAPAADTRVGGTETILLVEDEPQVRALVRRILELHGYSVLEASQGQEALEVSDRHPDRIDLLLTDVVMPRLNGRRLFGELEARRPGLRVLYMSGYTETAFGSGSGPAPGIAFIQKPFDPPELARRIRMILDASPPGAM